ncbi:MAG: alpha/beta fold hydrolase [Candidatus Lokiarchaeota archaeon]|nr:alpha/beta fold hydrolase [Candidatus Lokiarchaeota archaeon]MBD3202241.1 alpha/beta fold hydrolase [Candidatus Lokiarchaeota archaeon]
MEFDNKQYDGIYEVTEVEIHNDGEIVRGIMYFPPQKYNKPYPLILFFHGFPQILTFKEIIRNFQILLDEGFAVILPNFRGYRLSEGEISLKSQVSDGLKLIEFSIQLAQNDIINGNDINILGYDLGGYISIIVSSLTDSINKILLISPILDLKTKVNTLEFRNSLNYLNRFLPGSVRGIKNVDKFISKTNTELKNEKFQIEKAFSNIKCKKMKIIIGKNDKITSPMFLETLFSNYRDKIDVNIIEGMDHDIIDHESFKQISDKVRRFFSK